MRVSVGPIQYHWPRAKMDEFYQAASRSLADIVYLGETVCAKRREYRLADWLETGKMLRDAGKEVVLSTMALIEAESELSSLKRILDNGLFHIEANDMAAVETLQEWGLPFVAGPTINAYNGHTLKELEACGMRRWLPPVELAGQDISDILAEFRSLVPSSDLDVEIWAYGRLPLAYSARCFTARALSLPKDQCEFRCIDYPQGMPIDSQEGEPLFTLNGIQTQSGKIQSLCANLDELPTRGISILRVSPLDLTSLNLVDALVGSVRSGQPFEFPLEAAQHCDGYWRGTAGMLNRAEPERESSSVMAPGR